MKIWKKEFSPTYKLENGVLVLDDIDIPLPPGFKSVPKLRSTVIFPPHSRAGDHFHARTRELFIGFGKGMQIIFADPKTNKVQAFNMDPEYHKGKLVVYQAALGVPHAVLNTSESIGCLIEFTSSAAHDLNNYPVNI